VLRYETGIDVGNLVGIYTQKGEAVALANADLSSGKIQAESHGIVATSARVLMPRGIYPKHW